MRTVTLTKEAVDYINKNKERFDITPRLHSVWNIKDICSYPNVCNGEMVVELTNFKGEWLRLPLSLVSTNTNELPEYQNPVTTSENINELHHILVQTCLNYMREHKLTDIDEIHFSADGLNSSYEYGEWTPGTDSSIDVIGLEFEEDETPYRARIGFQM
jgi:hypothetical protein